MDELQCVTIPPHFFLIAVAQKGSSKDQRPNARAVDLYAFDAVRGHRAFNQGVL